MPPISYRLRLLPLAILLAGLGTGTASANWAKSWAQGTAAGADVVPHQETVCYWVGVAQGQSYECGSIAWGTEWAFRDSNFADPDNDFSLLPASSAAGNTAQVEGGSSAAFAETALFLNKAKLETHSAPKGGATANASSDWSAGLLMNAPGNPLLTGFIAFRVDGETHYNGDSEFNWSFTASYKSGGDPDMPEYFTSQATVAGGTAPAPIQNPNRPPIGGGNYTYLGTLENVDYQLLLPIQFRDGGEVSAKLELTGKSWADRLTRVVVGGDFFDLDYDQQADDWLDRLVASVEEDKAEGDVMLDFSHTVTVAGLYVPEGVSVSLPGGGALPFPVFYTAPVPEPEAWAMLLAGLILVGSATRRQTR